MPKVGGEHVFSHKAFGPTGSFICTWALLGIIFYVMCKLKYKHEFGHIEI